MSFDKLRKDTNIDFEKAKKQTLKSKQTQFCVHIDYSLYRKFKSYLASEGIKIKDAMADAIRLYLKKGGPSP